MQNNPVKTRLICPQSIPRLAEMKHNRKRDCFYPYSVYGYPFIQDSETESSGSEVQGENKKTRRRSKIKLIKDLRGRRTTFLKRHRGLFKKAHDLAILCGVEIGIFLKDDFQMRIIHYSSEFENATDCEEKESQWYDQMQHGMPGYSVLKVRKVQNY